MHCNANSSDEARHPTHTLAPAIPTGELPSRLYLLSVRVNTYRIIDSMPSITSTSRPAGVSYHPRPRQGGAAQRHHRSHFATQLRAAVIVPRIEFDWQNDWSESFCMGPIPGSDSRVRFRPPGAKLPTFGPLSRERTRRTQPGHSPLGTVLVHDCSAIVVAAVRGQASAHVRVRCAAHDETR